MRCVSISLDVPKASVMQSTSNSTTFLLLVTCGHLVSVLPVNNLSNEYCSDQIGPKPRWYFKQTSCFMCLKYMFPSTSDQLNFTLLDVDRSETVDAACAKVLRGHADLRSALLDCRRRVTKCCNAASACCDVQLKWRQEQQIRSHSKGSESSSESFVPSVGTDCCASMRHAMAQ